MNLPTDTYTFEGDFFTVTERDGSCYFIEAKYLDDIPNDEECTFEASSGFAAVNSQDSEGNGIDGVFATEAEAEAHLIARFSEPDEDAYEGDSSAVGY